VGNKTKKIFVFFILTSVAFISHAQADPIQNHSFESPTIPGIKDSIQVNSPSNYITNWDVYSGTVNYIKSASYDGNYSIDLNGDRNGAISQTFTTVPGTSYVLSFWMSGNPDGPATKTLGVTVSGISQNFQYFEDGGIPNYDSWTPIP